MPDIDPTTMNAYLQAAGIQPKAPDTMDLVFQNADSVERVLGYNAGHTFRNAAADGTTIEHGRRLREETDREIDLIRRQQRVKHFERIEQYMARGWPLAPEDAEWYQQVQARKGVQTKPPGATARDVPRAQGSEDIGAQLTLGENAAVTLEAMTAAKVDPAYNRGFINGVQRPVPSVADTYKHEQIPEQVSAPATKLHPAIIPIADGAVAGRTESGQLLDNEGRPIGPGEGMRYGNRLPSDVGLGSRTGDQDKFAQDAIELMYGDHLEAVEENGGKWPAGYFQNMSAETKENIKKGVTDLMRRRRNART